jgi:transaldolase
MVNPLQALHDHDQSFWVDYIDRELVSSGGIQRLINEDGLRGLTSNPSIFQAAISGSDDYDEDIRAVIAADTNWNTKRVYEALAVKDIRAAADALRPIHEESNERDGFVSLEVSPHLARDTAGTLSEARWLWGVVDRPNLMIKVPATAEGLPAIEELIASDINVNVTLIFSVADHYEGAAQAYIRGVERNPDPRRIASVASFFVSRVDTAIDAKLEGNGSPDALDLRGRAAVANGKQAYARFQELFKSGRFERQRARGARPQRVLWGSTSTKNPDYRDVLYVEALIGPETVNTIPPKTVDAFRDHGAVRTTLTSGLPEANDVLRRIGELGVDMAGVTSKLQLDGVEAFTSAFDQLLTALTAKLEIISPPEATRAASGTN